MIAHESLPSPQGRVSNWREKITGAIYFVNATALILFGVLYVSAGRIMPYHQAVLGGDWTQLRPELQLLLLSMIRAAGTGFFLTGLGALLLLLTSENTNVKKHAAPLLLVLGDGTLTFITGNLAFRSGVATPWPLCAAGTALVIFAYVLSSRGSNGRTQNAAKQGTMMALKFENLPRIRHRSGDLDLDLPIAYEQANNLTCFFRVDLDTARRMIPEPGFRPVRHAGRGIAVISFFEYIQCDLAPYNEAALALLVVPESAANPWNIYLDLIKGEKTRSSGAYIFDLPVTTEEACEYGRRFWGYPKFVTGIDFSLNKKKFMGRIHGPNGDGPVASLRGSYGPGFPFLPLSFSLFSRLGTENLKTFVQVHTAGHLAGGGELRLTVGHTPHPMARRLRELDLDGKRPFMVLANRNMRSLLHAGIPFAQAVD